MITKGNIYAVFAVLFSASHVFAKPEQSKAALACDELFNPENIEKMCCTSLDQFVGDSEECDGSSSEEYTCEKAICSMKNFDVLDSDNQVDEKKYEAYLNKIEKEKPSEKPTIDIIKKQCLDGKFKTYPSPDNDCSAIKLQICALLHSTVECTTWRTDDECSKLASSASECKPYMKEVLEKINQ